ncbi:aminotransferase class I/II-fold pyridoxal phosphate-dependent enzyme [Salinicola corii]|uniref:Aminotransferase n=1 Tax=Salinicola corii TaxID=2606937 RepID=A0A640WAV3_9GAMM|nr:aminotransferase class I/II-fold pyridoxal phosphate-dependent enzyme [Salinicola corii]KAA0016428.1 aminotransferase class I/II-fold pyridoxal phosphate-dependent enzyme [Salinicola corii]
MRSADPHHVSPRYAQLTQRIAGEGASAWNIHFRAKARQARGEDVIILSVGDPDFDTPPSIVDAAVDSLRRGVTHYADVQGKQALRERIAAYHRAHGGQPETSADHVAVLAGAQCGLYATAQCLLDPGDEVIIPEPAYVTYEAVVQSTGAVPVWVSLPPDEGFQPRPADIEAAITPRTKAILINSPHNPTGQCLTPAMWETIATLCRKHDLWLIVDAVYADLIFDGEHLSPDSLPGMAERTVVISSLSKSHAMTGWRLGWVVGPRPLMAHLVNLALCMLYGCQPFIQDAAIAAFDAPPAALDMMRETYRQRRDAVVDTLRDSETVATLPPAAGMFMMIDIRATGLSTHAFADRLLDEHGVSVLAGEAFGASAAGFVRLSLTVDADRLREACRRIERCAQECQGESRLAARPLDGMTS